jgi:hypothetical protein
LGCIWQEIWSITRIVLSTHHQYRRIYVQLNIAAWIARVVIILDFTGTRFDIAQSGYCALYLAAYVECNALLLSIYHQSQRRYVQLNIEAWIARNVIILVLTGTWIDIAQTAHCAPYLATYVDNNALPFVDTPTIAAEIRSVEYWRLNSRKCNNIGFDRYQRWHGANLLLCPVFRAVDDDFYKA